MIEPFVAYEASAGSGKTFALSIRYISLLFLGVEPNRILTLTFTNKAAKEMRYRIEDILKNLESKESELNELSRVLNLSKEDILSQRKRVYQRYLKSDEFILTIDKFCTIILRKFSLYVGLMPEFTIEQKKSMENIVAVFIKTLRENSLYKDFIEFTVFEEAKLNSIFSILDFFYQKFYDLPPKKSKRDFKESLLMQKFNILKSEILSCEKLSNSGKNALEAKSAEDILKKGWICKESLSEYNYFKKCFNSSWDEVFFELKELLRDYTLYRESKYVNNLIEFFQLYKHSIFKSKKELNDLRFCDIASFTYKILSEGIDRDFFYFRLDSRFDHILIDEFQDTSILQYKILEPLFDEITSGIGSGENRSLFYVGDVKQSIYRFRGGSKELFYDVAKRYGLEVKKLNTNYRSKKEIVEFVNETFRELIPGYFDQKANDKGSGYIKVSKSSDPIDEIKKCVKALLESGVDENDIAILTFTNDEATFISNELKEEHEELTISINPNLLVKDDEEVKIIIECMKYAYFKEDIYLENIKALTGKEEIDLSLFDKNLNLLVFSKKCIDFFGLHGKVVFEFMGILQRYSDIENFLFNLEEFSDEVQAKDIKGLKVLTIHKSKGLEFDHLIVCDRLGRKTGDRSSFLLYEEDLSIKDIFLKVKNRECLDEEYKMAYLHEKKLSIEDELNALYVAFTRAKESLFVICKDKNSAFERLSLKELERGEIQSFKEKKDTKNFEKFVYEEPNVGKQEQDIEKEEIKDLQWDFDAINFGLATHYMLEMLKDFKEDEIDTAFISMLNRYLELLGEEKANHIKKRVDRLLKDAKFSSLVKDASVCHRELPLVFENSLKQIDLLIEKEKEYMVVDYKTSTFVQNEHIEQVRGYIKAVKNIKPGKKVLGYLCYIREDDIKIVEVENG